MLPSLLAREITEGLKGFVVTGFESSTPYFSELFSRFVEQPGNLYKGPYLSIALPFRTGGQGGTDFDGLQIPFTPHLHQEQAWSRLRSGGEAVSTIIATGTGSGKTECFLYPLIDHCRRAPDPGIKAIVIYPMNALANDQAKRFASAIHTTGSTRGQIRVGLFVGEGEHTPFKAMGPDQVITDKGTLREDPPDILLTNYKMLDYLLVRPKDRRLWRYNEPESLRYLVVDELHSFDGAQGTDLACLLRRLYARLRTPADRIIAVGTSATLGSGAEEGRLTDYAQRIFQVHFDDSSVIGERRQTANEFLGEELIEFQFLPSEALGERLAPEGYRTVEAFIAAQYALFFPGQPDARPGEMAWRQQLGKELKQHLLVHNLLRLMDDKPHPLEALAAEIGKTLPAGEPRGQAARILDSLCALIAWSRDPRDPTAPLVQLRMQLWVRELRRMVMRVPTAPWEPDAEGSDDTAPSLTFADDHKQDSDELYLPLLQCSECRATAWAGYKPAAQSALKPDLRAIYNAFFKHESELVMAFPLREGEEPPVAAGEVRHLCGACGHLQAGGEQCQACGHDALQRVYLPVVQRQKKIRGLVELVSEHHCPVCGAQDSMMVFGARTATLSSVAIQHDYATRYNDDKKLIAFSDSVQDAAHRAGFFGARTWQNNIRMAIAQALTALTEGPIPLTEFHRHLVGYWSDRSINPDAFTRQRFISEFIAPNMLWYQDYEALKRDGVPPPGSTLFDDVCKRLEWEVLAEFGYRARIGRSLERTATAAMGIDLEPVRQAAQAALPVLQEGLGLHDLEPGELERFLLGLLLHLKEKGAIYHRFLDTYIENGGKTYLLNRQSYLPRFAEYSASPVFLTDAARPGRFEGLIHKQGQSWCQRWCAKTLGGQRLLPPGIEAELYPRALNALTDVGVLKMFAAKGHSIWGLDPGVLYLSGDVAPLCTPGRRSRLCVPSAMSEAVCGLPSLIANDPGHYRADENEGHWLGHLYREGEIHRVVAAEHTGLLTREDRETLEARFIHGKRPWDPNLLSATPTLEMGIDIGDLSSVLLCSVPPSQANYLQRIGRAGRRDGNAFNLTVANARPHDLYFYADPIQIMAGEVDPPGVFLNASAVVVRQLVAYCLDCWVATGVDESAIPATMRPVLDTVEKADLNRFPYTLIDFIKQNAPELLEGFQGLFGAEFNERTRAYLRHALLGDSDDIESVEMRLVKRLHELVKERQRLRSRIDALKRHINRLHKQPQDQATQQEAEEAALERAGLQGVLRTINARDTLNFFTDEGLIPNYAFPEAGVTLRSVIFRRRNEPREGESRYESVVYEYERPGAAAISELAPANRFYAGGRHVRVEQIDLGLSEIEQWRFCPRCAHAENLATGDHHDKCPRCHDPLWADISQKRPMIRLRQVMANTSDRDSRIGDESEDREPVFYTRQMLADFGADEVETAYRVADDRLPFGFEFIRKTRFREVNFGEYGDGPEHVVIAGREAWRPGFVLCRHCGMVQEARRKEQKHAFTCKAPDKQYPENLIECLYLYREFASEAIRILLPQSAVEGSDRVLNSFVAALQLGLKKKFGGQVDHLRLMSYEEPASDGSGERHFVMLYDSVPGGTGYLHELMRSSRHLLEVFELARETMAQCECNNDPSKDGCYHCLYAYRNSYGMETTSRDTAVAILGDILEAKDRFETVATIGDIKPNPVLDSELEVRFIEAVRRYPIKGQQDVRIQQQVVNGKPGYFLRVGEQLYTLEPQVKLGPGDGVQFACCPDFLIRSAQTRTGFKPIALFLDGYEFHKDKLMDDTAKRLAIVQSDRYWQWALTWNDVNEQFVKSTIQSRNPFTEGLHEAMQAMQQRAAQSLGLNAILKLPNQSPLDQLMAYLAEPEPEKWAGLAFVRCLGWFDKQTMRSEALRERFEARFSSMGSEGFRQAIGDLPGDRAYGGLAWALGEDPLSVLCVLPLEGIQALEPGLLAIGIVMDDSHGFETDVYKAAWFGLLRLYNLLQFLPLTGYFTQAGAGKGVYEPITLGYAKTVLAPEGELAVEGLGGAPEIDEAIDESVAEVREGLRQLVTQGCPLPQVAFELQDGQGEIVAEAELAWPERRVAGLLREQEVFSAVFEASGWTTITLDPDGQWVGRTDALLMGVKHD